MFLEGMILKPNMVVPGKKSAQKAGPEQVAEATVRTLRRQVPSAVPGIAFLSGGQSPGGGDAHLSLMNAAGPLPWTLTFSYGRALQEDCAQRLGRQVDGILRRPAGAVRSREVERLGGGGSLQGLHGKSPRLEAARSSKVPGVIGTRKLDSHTIEPIRLHH